jgi:hypothetical protein
MHRGGTPYQRAREFGLVGGFASGKADAAERRKRYLAEKPWVPSTNAQTDFPRGDRRQPPHRALRIAPAPP